MRSVSLIIRMVTWNEEQEMKPLGCYLNNFRIRPDVAT
jgi:hypothetical protein